MQGECTPEQKAACALKRCFVDKHHYYFPKREYATSLERTFRNLGENIIEMCRHEHNELHATQEPPEKPSLQHMAEAVVRSEVHMTKKVEHQVANVLHRQQEVINQYWRTADARR